MIKEQFEVDIKEFGGWGTIYNETVVLRYAVPYCVPIDRVVDYIVEQLTKIATIQGISISNIRNYDTLKAVQTKYVQEDRLSNGWYFYQVVLYGDRSMTSATATLERVCKSIGSIYAENGIVKDLDREEAMAEVGPFALYATWMDLITTMSSPRSVCTSLCNKDTDSIAAIQEIEGGKKNVGIGFYSDIAKQYSQNKPVIKINCVIFDSYKSGLSYQQLGDRALISISSFDRARPNLNFYYFNRLINGTIAWFKKTGEKVFDIKDDIFYTSDSKYGLEEIEEYHDIFKHYGFRVVRNLLHHSSKIIDGSRGGIVSDEIFGGGMITFAGYPVSSIKFDTLGTGLNYAYEDVAFFVKQKNCRFPMAARTYFSTKTDKTFPMYNNKSIHALISYPCIDSKFDPTLITFFEKMAERNFARNEIGDILQDFVNYIKDFQPTATPLEDDGDDIIVRWFEANTKNADSTDAHIIKMFNKQKEQLISQYRDMAKYLKNFDFSNCRPVPGLKIDEKTRQMGKKKLIINPEKEEITHVMGLPIPHTTNVRITGTLNLINKKKKKVVRKIFDIDNYYDKDTNEYTLKYNVLKRGKKKC